MKSSFIQINFLLNFNCNLASTGVNRAEINLAKFFRRSITGFQQNIMKGTEKPEITAKWGCVILSKSTFNLTWWKLLCIWSEWRCFHNLFLNTTAPVTNHISIILSFCWVGFTVYLGIPFRWKEHCDNFATAEYSTCIIMSGFFLVGMGG